YTTLFRSVPAGRAHHRCGAFGAARGRARRLRVVARRFQAPPRVHPRGRLPARHAREDREGGAAPPPGELAQLRAIAAPCGPAGRPAPVLPGGADRPARRGSGATSWTRGWREARALSPAFPILSARRRSPAARDQEPFMKPLRQFRRIDPDKAVGIALALILPWLPLLSLTS